MEKTYYTQRDLDSHRGWSIRLQLGGLAFDQPDNIPNSMLRLTKVRQPRYHRRWRVTYLAPSCAARF